MAGPASRLGDPILPFRFLRPFEDVIDEDLDSTVSRDQYGWQALTANEGTGSVAGGTGRT